MMLRLVRTFRTKAGRTKIAPKTNSAFDPFKKPAFQRFEDLPASQQEAAKTQALQEFDKNVDNNPQMEIPSEYSMIAAIKQEARQNRLNRDEIRDNILHFFHLTMQAREQQMAHPTNVTVIQRGREDDRSLLFDALEVLPKNHADIFSPEEYVAFFNLAKLGTVSDQARDMKTVCDLFYPLNIFRVDPYNEMEYLQLLLDSDQAQKALKYQQARLNHKNQDVKELRWYHEFGVAVLLSLGRIKDANFEAGKIISQFSWLESNLLVHLCKTATDSETMDKWSQQLLRQMQDTEAILTRDPAVSLGNLTFTNIITKRGGVKRPFCESEEQLETALSAKTVSVAHLTELTRLYIMKGLDIKKLIKDPRVTRLLTSDTDIGLILATEAALVAKESNNNSNIKSRADPNAAIKLFETLTDQCPSLLTTPLFYTHWLNVLTYFDKRRVGHVIELMEANGVKQDSSHLVAMATYYLKHDYEKAVCLLETDTPAIWGVFLRHYARTQDDEQFNNVLELFLSKKRKPSPSTISAVVNYYHKQKDYGSLWRQFNHITLNKYSPHDHLRTAAVFSSQLYKLLWKILTDYYRSKGDRAILGKPSHVHSVAGTSPRADSAWQGEWVSDGVRKWELVNEECAPAPRNLFLKMIAEQQVHSCSPIDIVPVFIRSGDFVGAIAVLRFYKDVVGYDMDGKEAGEISQVLGKIKKQVFRTRDLKRPVMDDHPLWMGLEVDLNLYIGDEVTETVEEVLKCLKEGKSTDCI
ncbi:hypothetical protein B0I72DRAFT_134730 [Yarrowia lipolytica]|uniref:Uncharacterized protein n=1 Tax=Yarrowia lipolytica TaxID=4952 RepID=A0A371CB31_YARLL|nr:hypothetical protein B0I71DRAFT_128908 [Yarrowia lipolytica]RDW34394.1 hypothetical protein B0I72DRAFT_134730 [Yarrowia lipolytica]